MSLSRVGAAAAAAALSGLAIFGFQAPASAQTYPASPSPAAATQGDSTDSTPARGQQVGITADPGSFDPNSGFTFFLDCGDGVQRGSGSGTAESDGSVDFQFTVPDDAPDGTCTLVLNGTLNGAASQVNIELEIQGDGSGGAGGSDTDTDGGALPRTGSQEILPLTAAGIALVVGGAAMVVVARRRRDDLAGSSTLA